ncbi:MAG: hypothetical protein ACRCTP_04195 [Aeromonas popoffii]|uniref:hypothetical protein n=1 Tax=Aeromonas popoffii TaxID=70856 RepID=UPI003F2BCD44
MFKFILRYCNVLLGAGEYFFAVLSLITFRFSFQQTPDYWGFMKELLEEAWDRLASLLSLGLVIPTLVVLGASKLLNDVDLDVWYEGDPELGAIHKAIVMACDTAFHKRLLFSVGLFIGVLLSTIIAFAALTVDLFFSLLGMVYIVDED